ncbi:hypothetical protein [Desulfosudis oleivorans]|uniref:Uncharacterized protein n=1 Tax=Desulfosudis oleivorans (strain DSM 6200 / JCM 39069 / Hxd3) TaxID=96561 RepID=A8ZUQ8_DESOH|nr:hypothetical protein [Desulfosudis oleivorans]ABW66471.1 hypothetical protein Dole_0661 [Desulfosudis oleivorans Hxd3]
MEIINFWTNNIISVLAKIGGLFGYTAFVITLSCAVVLNESLLHDDSYIVGWAAAWFILPALLLYLVLERLTVGRIKHIAVAVYSFLFIGYGILVEVIGGEGAGYGVFFIVVYLVSLAFTLPVLRYLSVRRVLVTLWCLGGLYAAAFGFVMSSYLVSIHRYNYL